MFMMQQTSLSQKLRSNKSIKMPLLLEWHFMRKHNYHAQINEGGQNYAADI